MSVSIRKHGRPDVVAGREPPPACSGPPQLLSLSSSTSTSKVQVPASMAITCPSLGAPAAAGSSRPRSSHRCPERRPPPRHHEERTHKGIGALEGSGPFHHVAEWMVHLKPAVLSVLRAELCEASTRTCGSSPGRRGSASQFPRVLAPVPRPPPSGPSGSPESGSVGAHGRRLPRWSRLDSPPRGLPPLPFLRGVAERSRPWIGGNDHWFSTHRSIL